MRNYQTELLIKRITAQIPIFQKKQSIFFFQQPRKDFLAKRLPVNSEPLSNKFNLFAKSWCVSDQEEAVQRLQSSTNIISNCVKQVVNKKTPDRLNINTHFYILCSTSSLTMWQLIQLSAFLYRKLFTFVRLY